MVDLSTSLPSKSKNPSTEIKLKLLNMIQEAFENLSALYISYSNSLAILPFSLTTILLSLPLRLNPPHFPLQSLYSFTTGVLLPLSSPHSQHPEASNSSKFRKATIFSKIYLPTLQHCYTMLSKRSLCSRILANTTLSNDH